ncbi:ANR35 protein, partial [Piprites chloris]|nr:ANR35 protein [Piprites chloris]
RSVGALREREARLERACRDKDGKLKQLLVETEKLSAEVLGLRGRSARLELQLEVGTVPPVPPRVTQGHPLSSGVTPGHPTSPFVTRVQQKQHRDTVAVYRTHLLRAAQVRGGDRDSPGCPGGGEQGSAQAAAPQGFMDDGVHAALLRILRDQAGAG